MEFEDILKDVGDNGKYQMLLVCFFLIPLSAMDALYDHIFMLTTPDHWCYVPQLANRSMNVQKVLIRPKSKEQGLDSYDSCLMYDIDYDLIDNTTTTLPFNTSDLKTKKCDNGWVYDTSQFKETASTHVCYYNFFHFYETNH